MKIVREDVVTKALALLDEVGIEGLTMRKLAEALKVQAPSLYWHFPKKIALLEAMADALLEPVGRGLPEAQPWEERLRVIAGDLRRALLSRRDASRVFAGTYVPNENTLRVGSLIHECLVAAGLDDRRASWGVFTFSHFVTGFAIEEEALRQIDAETMEKSRSQARHLLVKYPLAAIALTEITVGNADERFAMGLQVNIYGFKAL